VRYVVTDEDFWRAYKRLSEEGRCDNPGGEEYRRLAAQWKLDGCPANLDLYIASHANPEADKAGPESYVLAP
jgi:hypothetical protein